MSSAGTQNDIARQDSSKFAPTASAKIEGEDEVGLRAGIARLVLLRMFKSIIFNLACRTICCGLPYSLLASLINGLTIYPWRHLSAFQLCRVGLIHAKLLFEQPAGDIDP